MAPNAHVLLLGDDMMQEVCPTAPGIELSTDPAVLHEMADTLDGLGSHRMALALRAQAAALAGRGPGCGLLRGRA